MMDDNGIVSLKTIAIIINDKNGARKASVEVIGLLSLSSKPLSHIKKVRPISKSPMYTVPSNASLFATTNESKKKR